MKIKMFNPYENEFLEHEKELTLKYLNIFYNEYFFYLVLLIVSDSNATGQNPRKQGLL